MPRMKLQKLMMLQKGFAWRLASRCNTSRNLCLDASDLYVHVGGLPSWLGDLLGMEQHAVCDPAGLHHEEKWRRNRAHGQR